MTKGTFIGSLRHHDVIPWDTDIDLFIPFSAIVTFKYSFKQLNRFRAEDNSSSSTKINEIYE
jgi:phosphorylcholine metabolism protein LicD